MYSTVNMGLTSWDQISDNFNHTQMDANWKAIDSHDHSFNKGVQINTAGIAANAVTTGLIAPQAVTNAQIAPNAVATSNIQNQAVTNAQIAPGSIYGNLIPNAAIVAAMLDPTIIPLGTVLTWWRPSGSNATPGGFWEIMDGRAWNGITNAMGPGGTALTTGNIPDMRGYFVQGADINGNVAPGIGSTGGSNSVSLAHSHAVNSHTHQVASHAHGIGTDGNHMHTWQGGLSMWSRANVFSGGAKYVGADPDGFNYPWNNVTMQTKDGDWVTNSYFSMYIKNLTSKPLWGQYDVSSSNPYTGGGSGNSSVTGQTDGPADMDNAGNHSHGGATQASGNLSTDGGTAHTTDTQLGGSVSVTPQNVALLYIMRVR